MPIAKFGEHQAHNALAALAASEVVIPVNGPLDGDLVGEALSSVKIPGRIEQIRTSPTIILDGGHNVNAAEALRKAIEESYDFKQLVGVVAMMRDKQVEEYLGVLEPILSSVVVTENSWRERVMPADELEKIAVDVFGRDRVIKEANLPDAIQTAVNMVDAEDELGVGYGHGVLICGSFVTAGDARLMLEEHASPTMRQAMAVHQPAVDPDDSDQPADKAEDEAADNLEDSVSPDDFDVFDVLGLGKEQASDAGNARPVPARPAPTQPAPSPTIPPTSGNPHPRHIGYPDTRHTENSLTPCISRNSPSADSNPSPPSPRCASSPASRRWSAPTVRASRTSSTP